MLGPSLCMRKKLEYPLGTQPGEMIVPNLA